MLTTNATLRATFIETPEGQENEFQIIHNGVTYKESDITWVFDYYGPTGRYSEEGMIRKPVKADFDKILKDNIECKIQIADDGDVILHYIQP